MRDDFRETVKRILGERVNFMCSNPGCRARTRGPQLASDKSLNLGVASHISAASEGGPRYNSHMTTESRSSIENGIYLCSTCAKLIDNDPAEFTISLLCQWKNEAESETKSSVGHMRPMISDFVAHEKGDIKRNLNLRDKMHNDFYLPLKDRYKHGRFSKPYNKFICSEVIIRSIDDTSYPEIDDSPGISGWFKLEVYDFYHNGIKFILRIHSGIIDNEGNWKIIDDNNNYDPNAFKEIKIWQLGRIPWRNIIHYDLKGDEYYLSPHIYCKFADKGMPYEDFEYMIFGDKYDWPLESGRKIKNSGD
jgi:hypothetical protein